MENLEPQEELRPNLFSYATSELSQDAFICWLADWADPKYRGSDADLHEIGQQFVVSMICKKKPDYDKLAIKTVKVRRQVGKLDVLIEGCLINLRFWLKTKRIPAITQTNSIGITDKCPNIIYQPE